MIFFKENLIYLRKQKGWSQKYCADLTGAKANSWNNWEKGLNYPQLEFIIKIADEFKVSLDALICQQLNRLIQKDSDIAVSDSDLVYIKEECPNCKDNERLMDSQIELISSLKAQIALLEKLKD